MYVQCTHDLRAKLATAVNLRAKPASQKIFHANLRSNRPAVDVVTCRTDELAYGTDVSLAVMAGNQMKESATAIADSTEDSAVTFLPNRAAESHVEVDDSGIRRPCEASTRSFISPMDSEEHITLPARTLMHLLRLAQKLAIKGIPIDAVPANVGSQKRRRPEGVVFMPQSHNVAASMPQPAVVVDLEQSSCSCRVVSMDAICTHVPPPDQARSETK